jgi:hypothetical protein
MTKFVGQLEVEAPLVLNGNAYPVYSYIVLPFCRNGTLLDLIMKANNQGVRLSKEFKNYLWL